MESVYLNLQLGKGERVFLCFLYGKEPRLVGVKDPAKIRGGMKVE